MAYCCPVSAKYLQIVSVQLLTVIVKTYMEEPCKSISGTGLDVIRRYNILFNRCGVVACMPVNPGLYPGLSKFKPYGLT